MERRGAGDHCSCNSSKRGRPRRTPPCRAETCSGCSGTRSRLRTSCTPSTAAAASRAACISSARIQPLSTTSPPFTATTMAPGWETTWPRAERMRCSSTTSGAGMRVSAPVTSASTPSERLRRSRRALPASFSASRRARTILSRSSMRRRRPRFGSRKYMAPAPSRKLPASALPIVVFFMASSLIPQAAGLFCSAFFSSSRRTSLALTGAKSS
jgi:hypothetical protein